MTAEDIHSPGVCQRCKTRVVEGGPFTDRGARVLDQPNFRLDLVWCFNCGMVSMREKSKMYHRYKLWQSGFWYRFFPFRPTGAFTLEEAAVRFVRMPGAFDMYMELLWYIRICLVTRAGGSHQSFDPNVEAAAWAMAKQKLSAFHLVEYAKMLSGTIGQATATQWVIGVENDFGPELQPHQREHIREVRMGMEKALINSG